MIALLAFGDDSNFLLDDVNDISRLDESIIKTCSFSWKKVHSHKTPLWVENYFTTVQSKK
jgi:hypothetical protein